MPVQSSFPKNKLRFLCKAVLEQDRSKASIAQIFTSNFGFDDLLTSLCEQYQIEKEVQETKIKCEPFHATLYQQYGRNPKYFHFGKGGRKPYNGSTPKSRNHSENRLNQIGKDRQRMRCSLCGSIEHFSRECPPGASLHFVRSKLARGVSAVHICHDLLNGIEELSQPIPDSSSDGIDPLLPDNINNVEEILSELHLFDELSNGMIDSDQSRFYEAFDKSIATNFISARIAGVDSDSPPEKFSSTPMSESDFRKDV